LLDSARDWAWAQGARRLQLLADADNAPALAFYRHLAWRPTRLFAWKQSRD
jgi:GNAT superfamily N-acetyltransferase